MNRKSADGNAPVLTIVVNSCDAYSDVLSLFFAAFQEYWPDCQYPVLINTESRSYGGYPATVHYYPATAGVDKWGARLRSVLKSISSEYVLLLCDDFILEAPVRISELKSAMDLLENNADSAVTYLTATSLPISEQNIFGGFVEVKDGSDFRLNSAPGIWRKSDLLNYTGPDDNPWAWEVFGSYRTYGDGKKIYTLKSGMPDIYPYNYSKGGAIYRGRWVRSVVLEKFDKYGLDIDPGIRGFSEDAPSEARSLKWKFNFILTGYRMVGLRSLLFVYRYFLAKING